MLETQRNTSTHRYANEKLLPLSLNKRRSCSTFYPKAKESSERGGQADKRQDRLKSLKEFIDVYFKDEGRGNSHRMPIITRRSQLFINDRIQRKSKKLFKAQEQLSKSLAYDNNPPNNDSFLPMATTLRWSVSVMEQQLPSIHEQTQGAQQQKQQQAVLNQTSQLSFLRKTSSLYSSQPNPEWEIESKNLTFQNQIFSIYVLFKEGKAVGRVKEFKEAGLPFMDRENRMKKYGIASLWKESKYNHRSFAISLRPPIKDQLLKIMPDEANPHQLKIKQKALHTRLTANHCQEMGLLLRQLCLQLKKVEGRVLNNKINPSNLFLKGSGVQPAEWAYSSFREEFTIRQGRFQKRRYGVLRGNDWFVSPEYLAPEIITQLFGEETEVWGKNSSPDIWSLGLTFFEMITLIPIWTTAKCSLIHRPSIIRNGVLASPGRELTLLHRKQLTIQKTIKRLLFSQTIQSQQNDKLFAVIVRMLQPDISKRISLDQILESL